MLSTVIGLQQALGKCELLLSFLCLSVQAFHCVSCVDRCVMYTHCNCPSKSYLISRVVIQHSIRFQPLNRRFLNILEHLFNKRRQVDSLWGIIIFLEMVTSNLSLRRTYKCSLLSGNKDSQSWIQVLTKRSFCSLYIDCISLVTGNVLQQADQS